MKRRTVITVDRDDIAAILTGGALPPELLAQLEGAFEYLLQDWVIAAERRELTIHENMLTQLKKAGPND